MKLTESPGAPPRPQETLRIHFQGDGRLRRALNLLVAVVALVLTLPVWLFIALAIKLTSPGPVFYTQVRIGLDRRDTARLPDDPRRRRNLGGRPFRMYKFRTMEVDAERRTGEVWSRAGDPRVTRVGRILRRYRLDELPQLLNVIKADMNVVGPRPERPTIFSELALRIPNYSTRQRTRPGITGYAQVNLEYDTCLDDVTTKLQYDLAYIEQQSIPTDLLIMARTFGVMFFPDRTLHHATSAPRGAILDR